MNIHVDTNTHAHVLYTCTHTYIHVHIYILTQAHTHVCIHTKIKEKLEQFPYNALQVGVASMENRLLQYGAKEYFFKAVICHFCLDADKARVSMA